MDIVKNIDNDERFDETMAELIDHQLTLSHTAFINPKKREYIEQQHSNETAPDFLKISSRIIPEYAYIKIPTFTLPLFSMDILLPLLKKSSSSNIVIFDLRLNTGGSGSSVGDLLGGFIEADKPYLYCRMNDWKEIGDPKIVYPLLEQEKINHALEIANICKNRYQLFHTSKMPKFKIDKPVIILIDQRAYSCGEVFPQCMKEYKRATIVGNKTAGAVVGARDDFDCGHGYSICLPFVELITSQGYNIEGNKVHPDIEYSFKTSDLEQLTHDEIVDIIKVVLRRNDE